MLYCDIVTDAMIKGLGQQKASVRYNIFTSALDVLFLYILLPRYGIAGYFASFLLTHVVNFILSLRRLMCITKQTISIRTTVCVIITAVISAGIASMAQLPLVRCFAYTLLLIFGLVLSGILGRNDIRWMKGLLRK